MSNHYIFRPLKYKYYASKNDTSTSEISNFQIFMFQNGNFCYRRESRGSENAARKCIYQNYFDELYDEKYIGLFFIKSDLQIISDISRNVVFSRRPSLRISLLLLNCISKNDRSKFCFFNLLFLHLLQMLLYFHQ